MQPEKLEGIENCEEFERRRRLNRTEMDQNQCSLWCGVQRDMSTVGGTERSVFADCSNCTGKCNKGKVEGFGIF